MYRWLLVVYPREHRREYGELMVQLFRDRMRRDGAGLGGAVVWKQMIIDLVGSSFKEHREGFDMKKGMWIATASVVALLAGVLGVNTLLAQSNGDLMISVSRATKTFSAEGAGGLPEAMRQAVDEVAIDRDTADEILRAYEELADGAPPSSNGLMISVWNAGKSFSAEDAGDLAEAMRQAVANGEIDQEVADEVLRTLAGEGSAKTWHRLSIAGPGGLAEAVERVVDEGVIGEPGKIQILGLLSGSPANTSQHFFSFSGAEGLAGAIRQAVDEGVISQDAADRILRSLEGENSGS